MQPVHAFETQQNLRIRVFITVTTPDIQCVHRQVSCALFSDTAHTTMIKYTKIGFAHTLPGHKSKRGGTTPNVDNVHEAKSEMKYHQTLHNSYSVCFRVGTHIIPLPGY